MVSANDRNVLRGVAAQWMEFAALPVMQDRKRLWRAVHGLRAKRSVIMFETDWIDGYFADIELLCEAPFLRSVEKGARIKLRQAAELATKSSSSRTTNLTWANSANWDATATSSSG